MQKWKRIQCVSFLLKSPPCFHKRRISSLRSAFPKSRTFCTLLSEMLACLELLVSENRISINVAFRRYENN